jgi:hypothetical protein
MGNPASIHGDAPYRRLEETMPSLHVLSSREEVSHPYDMYGSRSTFCPLLFVARKSVILIIYVWVCFHSKIEPAGVDGLIVSM